MKHSSAGISIIFSVRMLSFLVVSDEDNDEEMSRLVNYIFPSISNGHSGLSKYLLRAFEYTAPISYMHMSIKDTTFGIGGSADEYASSSFGAIEDALRKELGVERIREDLSILLCKAGE